LSLAQLTGEGGKNTDDDSKNSGNFLYIYTFFFLIASALLGLVLGSADPKLDPESESDPKRLVMVDKGAFLTGLLVKTHNFELFSNKEMHNMTAMSCRSFII
jgi:hypothetical protein